ISVDSTGKVIAQINNGSALIVAEAGEIKSAPLLVVATTPVANAILLKDTHIIGDPVETNPDADPSFDNTYKVVIEGITPPEVGAILINTESKPVVGRVISVQTAGGRMTVILGMVSVREAFPDLSINEVIDLSQAPVSFPQEITDAYDIKRVGNKFDFTPKPGTRFSGERFAPMGTRALPPFKKCEVSTTPSFDALPLQLSVPPIFSVTLAPSFDLLYTPANGLERLIIKGEPTFTFEGGVSVMVAFEGKVTCEVILYDIRIPVGGPLSFFFGGIVPVGIEMEAGGKLPLAGVVVKSQFETKLSTQIGIACPGGVDCAFVRSFDATKPEFKPTVETPNLIEQLRLEPTMAVSALIKGEVGNPFLEKLRFNALKVNGGGKFEGSFAPQITQILDTAYKSNYKVLLQGNASLGTDIESALKLFGLSSLTGASLTISKEIGKSPVAQSITVDRDTFVGGDLVNFNVKLEPETADFFPGIGPYNIEKVMLVRKVAGVATEVASITPTDQQTNFTIPFQSPIVGVGNFGSTSDFFVFVKTVLLPLDILSLELGVPNRRAISAGYHHTCALTPAGGVKCWGGNDFGQLGNGTHRATSTPVDVIGLTSGVRAISSGLVNTCALTTTGGVKCWGGNDHGELGDGTRTARSTPVDVIGLTSGVSAISAGYITCALISTTGGVKCWGPNDSGQLGSGTMTAPSTPVDVIGLTSGVRAISVGAIHACALTTAGGVKCWGFNLAGGLGAGAIGDSFSPVDVIGLTSGVSAISAGAYHVCALTAGGVKCWGFNVNGQLGNGERTESPIPVNVSGLSTGMSAISAGTYHSCALTTAGGVKCWGSSRNGQLGNGTTT
ncbi:MAG: hypothetical protein AAB317_01075, partial [Nitrospirota bacterium]